MLDGIFCNPTKILFGKTVAEKIGEETAQHSKKILLHYGGGSIKLNGVYQKVAKSLNRAGVSFLDLGGVKPNPRADLVYEGIKLCRQEGINFILAVGGGSVIDSAKAIAIGTPYQGDFYDFFERKKVSKKALKVGTVLTIPGSGSESSPASVITHEKKGTKLPYAHALMIPVFSILNPETTFSLSMYQTTCGLVDAISHVFERYFSNTTYVDCTDRIGEGLIKTLMKYAYLIRQDPKNYDIRAEIMWACKLAHDETSGFGRQQDWSSHTIAHELGAIYDVAHGAALGVIFPAWMRYSYTTNINRFIQLADRVFDIDRQDEDQAILMAIGKYQEFLKSIGMPGTLRDLGISDKEHFEKISKNCVRFMKSRTIGNFIRLHPKDIIEILELAF